VDLKNWSETVEDLNKRCAICGKWNDYRDNDGWGSCEAGGKTNEACFTHELHYCDEWEPQKG
jgi:hypothetical protein